MALLSLGLLVLYVATSQCQIDVESLENATLLLAKTFQEIRNQVLGVDVLAAEYQRVGFTFSTLDPTTALSNTFPDEKISGVFDLFVNLNNSDLLNSGQALATSGSEMAPAPCCDVPTARSSSCCYGCSSRPPADLSLVSNISSSFATAFPSLSTNLMGLTLQYGHSNGALLSFPTPQRQLECTQQDARLQPWYVNLLRKRRREVVLLVDVLNSANKDGKTKTLRDAAVAVLRSLTPQDQVQAVVFAEDVSAGSVLLNGGLVSVCPSHISILEGFILTAKPSNRPGAIGAYDRAFKTAFGLFSDSESDKIILFFTSASNFFTPFGVPTAGLLSNITFLNENRGNDVVISAYIVLRDLQDRRSVVKDFLGPLVNKSSGNIVDLDNNIESRVGGYYSVFETADNLVSVGQEVDPNGNLSLAISVALFNNTCILGVLHATLPWQQLFSHVAMEVDKRRHSYFFVVSEGGKVLYHPLLPGNFQSDVYIGTIEHPDLDGMFNDTTDISLTVKRLQLTEVAMGEVEENSFISHNISVTYTCRSLRISDTVLFVCVAVADVDRTVAKMRSVQLASLYSGDSGRKPLYHTTQIPEKEKCLYFCSISTKDRVSLQFTSPSLPSDATTLQEITDYIGGKVTSEPSWAERGVVSEVAVTSVVTKTWLSRGNQINNYITRRHLATPSGVYLTYPFASFFANFVPRYTEWYVLATVHPNLLTLTPPRLDSLKEGGYIVSAAFALTSPNAEKESPTASTDGQTLAVVAADMTLTSLRKLLQDAFPECSFSSSSSSSRPHCFLLDDQGNLLFHNDFLDPDFQHHLREPIFFANATSMLTNHNAFQYILWKTLESGLASKGRCTDYLDEDIQQRLFFSLDLISNTTYSGSSAFNDYAIRRIPGTNAYLGAVHQKRRSDLICICTHSCQTCRLQSTGCECPCSCPETCSASSMLSFQACPPAKFGNSNLGVNNFKIPQDDGNDLPFCSDLECACYANSTACEAVRDCHWCSNFCRHISEFSASEQCKGTVSCSAHSSSSPRCSSMLTKKDTNNTATIVGAVIGALLGLILIAVFVVFLIWHQFCRKAGEEEQKEENAFDFSKTKRSAKNPGYGEVGKKGDVDGNAGTGGGDGDADLATDKSKEAAEETTF